MRRTFFLVIALLAIGASTVQASEGVSERLLRELAKDNDRPPLMLNQFPAAIPAATARPEPTSAPAKASVSRLESAQTFRVLTVTYGALAGLDWLTTSQALERGAVERNPLLGQVASRAPAFAAAKTVATAATIYGAHKLWKRHKVAAVVTMATLNVAMVSVVAHNASVNRNAMRPI